MGSHFRPVPAQGRGRSWGGGEARGDLPVQAGVFPKNVGSRSLLEACGFRLVGVRERLGMIQWMWRDVVLYERRSQAVGT